MPRITVATREQVREDLRRAARAAFQSRGLAGLTMRAVAEEAGCAVGALYTYFPDKDALVREVAADSLGELGRVVAGAVDAASGPGGAVRAAADAVRQVYGAERPAAALLPVLLTPGGVADEEFQRRVTGRLIAALGPIAASRRSAGRPPDAANAETLAIASFLFGLVLLESSGQLARLEVPAGEVLAAFVWGG